MTDAPDQSERARREEARRLRQQRQTTVNLVWSLIASLGLVVFLVVVVARPDVSQTPRIDWQAVAASSSDSAPGALVVPRLNDSWTANRADLSQDGDVTVWTIGLLGPAGEFVQVLQGFEATSSWEESQVLGSALTEEVVLPGANGATILWRFYDRSEAEDPGNRVFVLATDTPSGTVIVAGTTRDAVSLVASDLSVSLPSGVAP